MVGFEMNEDTFDRTHVIQIETISLDAFPSYHSLFKVVTTQIRGIRCIKLIVYLHSCFYFALPYQ